MKLATWNIGWWFIYSKENDEYDLENIEYFIDRISKNNVDIICLQEIHLSESNNQAKKIAKNLNYDFYVSEINANSHLKDNDKIWFSIISKYPIISSKFHKLINPNLEFLWKWKKAKSHDKWFLEAIINCNGIKIRVLSGHMLPFFLFWEDFLDDKFKNIRNQIENIILKDNIPTLIWVDLNFEDIKNLLPNIFNNWYESILPNESTASFEPNKIDKIIISKHFKLNNSIILETKSDHYLCIADIDI